MNKLAEVVEALRGWAKPNGYDPLIILAHGHVETGGYTCELSKRNNYFGRFADKDWWGDTYDCQTHEYETVNGKTERVPHITKFKVFQNPVQAFLDYDKYVSFKFPEAYKHRTEYRPYYTNLMTYIDGFDGQKKIVYPSFCTAVGYESVLIKRYEELAKGSGGYELVQILNS